MGAVNIKTPATVEQERIEGLKKQVRAERDLLLKECDYIAMPDYPMADKSAWEKYRQDLRDVTDQSGYPESVDWPVKPE